MQLSLVYKVSGGAEVVYISSGNKEQAAVTVYWPSKSQPAPAIELNSAAVDHRCIDDLTGTLLVAEKIHDHCADLRDISSDTSTTYAQFICKKILNQSTAIITEHQAVAGFSEEAVESLVIEWPRIV